MAVGQDQKPHIVGDQLQPPPLQGRLPANPLIARGALQRGRTPTEQCDPVCPPTGDIVQRFAHDALKSQIVMLAHQ